MSRLRKRAGKRLREPFGKAGLTVAIVALVMALVGGAYAAGGLTKSQENQVKKIAKKYAGKPGAPGAAGAAGAKGDKGDPGAAGANGKDGTDGTDGAPGTNGTNGKSVVVGSFTKADEEAGDPFGEPCALQGGLEVEVEDAGTPEIVCNGKEGSPWTLDGTLPPGATETGGWAFTGNDATPTMVSPISFAVPVAQPLSTDHVHYLPKESETEAIADFEAVCGSFEEGWLNPTADPGELCVYYNPFGGLPANATFSHISGLHSLAEPQPGQLATGKSGAVVVFTFSGLAGEAATGVGSWAVTGCSTEVGTAFPCP